jgi:hypothetical protein
VTNSSQAPVFLSTKAMTTNYLRLNLRRQNVFGQNLRTAKVRNKAFSTRFFRLTNIVPQKLFDSFGKNCIIWLRLAL